MTHLTGKNESRPLFLTHCIYVEKSFIEMLLEWSSTEYMWNLIDCCYGNQKDSPVKRF